MTTETVSAPQVADRGDGKMDCPSWLPCGGAPNALQLYKDGHAVCDFDGEYFDPEQVAQLRKHGQADGASEPAPDPKPKSKRGRKPKAQAGIQDEADDDAEGEDAESDEDGDGDDAGDGAAESE